MAISKVGLDYFPHDVDLMRNRKLIKPRKKYGVVAVHVYMALLEMIYHEGYYLRYDDDTRDSVLWDLQIYCQGKYPPSDETISGVIEMLVECELFSGYHFKQGVITSRRIQEVYYRSTVERKNVCVDPKIWMLSVSEMEGLSTKSSILSIFQNQPTIDRLSTDSGPIMEDNQPIMEDNQPIMPQSKVNKSKVNKSKVKESRVNESTENPSDSSPSFTPTLTDVINYAAERNSKVNPERFFDYYKALNWKCGSSPITDWQAKFRCWEKSEKSEASTNAKAEIKPTAFSNYEQRTYTEEELQEIMERKRARMKR